MVSQTERSAASQPAPPPQSTLDDAPAATGASDDDAVKETLVTIIGQLDQGDGVDFETVLTNADARGIDRQLAEAKLDELSNEGTLHEPRFGWFRIVS